jgi:small nuclear ribonucleoprotein (snRNP)-like protein
MGIPADIGESIKKHIYSIATGLIIALLTFGYVSYILPANERKEDAKNIAILKGIERQLNAYIDDQVKYISEDKMKSLKLDTYKGSTVVHIDTITIEKSGREQLQDGTITLSRRIKLSGISKNKNFTQKDSIFKDTLSIDLVKFLNKINSTTHFTSFYICPVVEGKCQVQKPILSENVSLVDQDSLIRNNRKNGPFSFRNSDKHYYTDQINIPQTNHTLFLAAGIDQSYFQTSVRQIDSNILIFSLLLIIILILGINFIKPIISSYKERLSQVDLVGVVFSVGILVAVMVVFGVLSIWDNTVKSRNIEDLTALVNKIDTSFTQQIETYQNWRNNDSLFGKKGENAKNKFAKIYLDTDSKITALNGEPLTESDSSLAAEQKIFLNNSDLKKDSNSKLINYLDGYFRMDKTGLITTNLSNTIPDIPRKYADRMYFKILQQRNLDNQNIEKNVNTVLTAVFSREDDKYQWIFAEKNILKNQKSENNGIKGIAFREFFSTEIELPPGTGYMLIDRHGDVLMQNDPEKNLYQNLLYGSQNNLELISLLAGKIPQSFEMEYQGIPYQICPIKLRAESDSPIYILGIRDLSHLNRLSIFTFSNGFLLSVFFGFLMLVIAYVYSTLFYSDHISMFSNHHFYHLFPDNSRTYEYKLLLKVTCIAILMGVLMSFLSSPSIAFFFCIILGINLALTNLITLNIRRVDPKTKLIKLLLIVYFLGVCLPMTFFLLNNSFLAIVVLFGTHISLILYHRNWRTRENVDLQTFISDNHGVNRKAYTLFLTSRLIFQFVVFPFVLISGFYMNELNDFVRYYCSSNQVKEQKINQKDFIIKDRIINAYSCDCKKDSIEKPLILGKNKDKILEKANVGFLDRPAMYEIKKFAFNKLSDKYYINSHAIVPKENKYSFLLIIFLLFIGLSVLAYQLINYYSNRFFFYDLMQAAYERYYPCTKKPLANEHIFIAMVNNDDIKSLIQVDPNKEAKSDNTSEDLANCPDRKINIDKVFDLDTNNEISPFLKMDFILKYNNKKFGKEYNDIWDSLTTETRYVLYDFAQDHFVNYKNKDTLMFLMEKGIIDCHQLTGRLKMMSLSFRIFILCRSKHDESFLQKFKEESKDGTFSKLKFPMLIIAISGLVLLMYLNKDSYDRVAVMGGSIVSVIALINKFLEANKSL